MPLRIFRVCRSFLLLATVIPVRVLAFIQAVYFALTGLWPLVHIKSFMAVTGPKQDLWLVRAVGVLVSVVGIVIAFAAARRAIDANVILLAVGAALGLT